MKYKHNKIKSIATHLYIKRYFKRYIPSLKEIDVVKRGKFDGEFYRCL